MMRILRICIYVLFVVTCAVFAWFWYNTEILSDKTIPKITIEGDMLTVGLETTDEELLAGVSAYDEKDGDLTDKVIVESISKFSEKGVCKVTYAVCDSDNHVASATRKIKYEGYTSPVFYLNRSLCFSHLETVNVASALGATDVIDGDISSSIIVTSTDYQYGFTGTYTIKAKVTNSKGDLAELELPLIVEERNVNAPEIELEKYLIYVDEGTTVNYRDYFIASTDSYNADVSDTLTIETDYKKDVPGIYSVHYYTTDSINRRGHAILMIIVG